uniref:Ribosome-associated heat shock protein Hsp15 n=1 Tax=Candidatus Kentrum sp. MB TaxID=2138164 RepID=A0A451BBB6_9GAMM|nr:MAG: ribosome-associated heat shock protein Hsp15 [Candidatus Kentron sp. MB]VFK32467.1 MAG: ribosome-associated heat shock protein Hsp15 [Candidatus Kentron sp. MB]VFK75596.1 MAG: ribosome-associated heat shock protein Hsp15 [Candidatus Kentron sp. MB]
MVQRSEARPRQVRDTNTSILDIAPFTTDTNLLMPRKNNAAASDKSGASDTPSDSQRLDKWLWAARFFKTRGLAAEAISGGKIHVEDQRAKPAKLIRAGARIRIRRGPMEWEVILEGLSKQRRPAPEAALLYRETPESIASRENEAERRKTETAKRERGMGRPTKRDRRRLTDFTGR